jgi:hypothetical protein
LSGGTVTGATSLRAGGTHLGNHEFASASSTSTGYSDAGIEIREGAYGSSSASAPRLAFHWGNVVASNISMDTAGAILIRNNPGTGYENLRANNIYANGTNVVWHAGNDGSGSGLDADLLDGTHKSGFFVQSGSWLGDLGSNGYTRENGLSMTGGSEFVLLSKSGQGSVLIDGAYISYESSNGFFGSYNASYANASGIRATNADTVSVMQLDGGNANLTVTGKTTTPKICIGADYGSSYPVSISTGQRYCIGFRNTGATNGSTNYPWFAHESDKFILHWNSIGDKFSIDHSGNVSASGSSSASIFYDNNDTNYFLNPAGDGTEAGRFNGNIEINPKSQTWAEGIAFYMPTQGLWGGLRWVRSYSAPYTGNWALGYLGGVSNDDFAFLSGDSVVRLRLDQSGNATVSGSSRAPIFYDSNDTAYFANPASTSNLNTIRLASHISVGGLSDAAPANVSTTGRITFGSLTTDAIDNYSIGTTLENYGGNYNKLDLAFHTGIRLGAHPNYGGVRFYADQTMASEIFAVGKSGNFVQAAHSMRAPIFYDSNNANYYVDPASTSSMWYLFMPHRGNGDANIKVNDGQQENWRAINVAMGGGNNAGIGYGNNTRSVFNRHNLAFHCGVNDSIRFHSDGWNTLFEVTGGVGDAWLKGQLQAQTLHLAGPSNTNYSYPNVKSYGSSNSGGVANYHLKFMALNGNANGHISTNYYATTYSTTSDYRVKEDFQPIINATSRLMSLNPVNFQWKDSDIRTDGFLAHEVAEVVSDAVVGEKDAVDEQGNDELQALDQSKLVPLLVKTIQEQQGVIEALEARISALEA